MNRQADDSTTSHEEFHGRSLADPEGFWLEQARLVDWKILPTLACDASRAPFTQWFAGATANLFHNAADRHLADRADQAALISLPTAGSRP